MFACETTNIITFLFVYDTVFLNYPKFPIIPINSHNSHRKFPIWNISKIPQLSYPWRVSRNLPEFFDPFATLLLGHPCWHSIRYQLRQGSPVGVQLWSVLAGSLGGQVDQTTVCHPQTTSLFEPFHWSLKKALCAAPLDGNWVDHLPWVMIGLYSAPKEELL